MWFFNCSDKLLTQVPDWPFRVCHRSQLSFQYGVLQDSASSTETSAAQINYVCLVSIAFTFYPSSYASLMLGASLPTVSSGNRGKENTWKVYYVPVGKPKGNSTWKNKEKNTGEVGMEKWMGSEASTKHRNTKAATKILSSKDLSLSSLVKSQYQ